MLRHKSPIWERREILTKRSFLLTYGFARISLMGSETVVQIIFGPNDCEPLLGVVALENIGIGVDPISKTLKRMAVKPLK